MGKSFERNFLFLVITNFQQVHCIEVQLKQPVVFIMNILQNVITFMMPCLK